MRRAVSVACMLTLALFAAPANALAGAEAVEATVVSPAAGAIVSDTIDVTGRGRSSSGIEKVEILVNGALALSQEPPNSQQELEITYTWDTNFYPGSSELLPNGDHQIIVRASTPSGATDTATSSVRVDNTPQRPSGLQASVAGRRVTLSWRANPEPDVGSYIVERNGGGGWEAAGEAQGATFTESPAPGSYSYRVFALRPSPSAGTTSSPPSAPVTAAVETPPDVGGGDGPRADNDPPGGSGETGTVAGSVPDTSTVDGKPFAAFGVPSGSSASSVGRLPDLPVIREPRGASRSQPLEWESYDEELPYELSAETEPQPAPVRSIAAESPSRLIPPEALRWGAVALLLLSLSMLLRVLALRLTLPPSQEPPR